MKKRRVLKVICSMLIATMLFGTTVYASSGNHPEYETENETAQLGAIVMTGSSLCEQFPIDEILEDTGDDYVIYNRGYGGYTMTQLMDVLDMVTDLIPSAVFINIGTNDIDRLDDDYTYEDMMDNYRTIIETIWESAPNCVIYMMAYYPCTANTGTGQITRTLEQINEANEYVEALAAELGCNYIDVSDVLKDDDGYLKEEYAADSIHLTDEAYYAIYEELKPYFDECVAMETYLNADLVLGSSDSSSDSDADVQESYTVDLERDATVTQDITIYEGSTATVTLNYSGMDTTVSFSIAGNSDETVCSASADTLEITIEGLSAGTSTVIASWTAVNSSGSTYTVQLNVTVLEAETEEEEDDSEAVTPPDDTDDTTADDDQSDAEDADGYSIDLERDATVTGTVDVEVGETVTVTLNYAGMDETVSFEIESISDESVCSATADILEIEITGISEGTAVVTSTWTAVNTSGSTYVVEITVNVTGASEETEPETTEPEETEPETTEPEETEPETDAGDADTEDGTDDGAGTEGTSADWEGYIAYLTEYAEENIDSLLPPDGDVTLESIIEDIEALTEDTYEDDTTYQVLTSVLGDAMTYAEYLEAYGGTSAEPETTEPEESEPETTEPETDDTDADDETAEPETAEPEESEPETTEPETDDTDADDETAEPETAEPETAEPETEDTDTAEPETAEPETDDAGTEDAGEAGSADAEDAGEAGSADAEDAGEAGSADAEDTADADDAEAEDTTDAGDTDAEETTDSDDTDTAAEVGDSFNMILYLALMAAALCTIAALVVRRRFQ